MRILLLEDEPRLAVLLERGLTEEGYEIRPARDLAAARSAVVQDPRPDLYLVDRMLPDGDGLDWLRERRADGDVTPAIVLTARDLLSERVEGLREGADDYLGKPFAFEELCARLAALTRRTRPPPPAAPEPPALQALGPLTLDRRRHELRRGDEVVPLTPQEFRLLDDLAVHAGTARSRSELLRDVWGLKFDPGTNVVDVYIRYLRQKLEGVDCIHTVRGVGYRLDPPE